MWKTEAAVENTIYGTVAGAVDSVYNYVMMDAEKHVWGSIVALSVRTWEASVWFKHGANRNVFCPLCDSASLHLLTIDHVGLSVGLRELFIKPHWPITIECFFWCRRAKELCDIRRGCMSWAPCPWIIRTVSVDMKKHWIRTWYRSEPRICGKEKVDLGSPSLIIWSLWT